MTQMEEVPDAVTQCDEVCVHVGSDRSWHKSLYVLREWSDDEDSEEVACICAHASRSTCMYAL